MPQTIQQAQKALLGTNFLNGIGTNKNSLIPRESATVLIQLAQDIIDQANANLDEAGHHSSGALSASLAIREPEIVNGSIHVSIQALDYYQYINKGVRGTKSGSGVFAFKNDNPSLSMVQAISDWAGRSFFASRNVKVTVTNQERKHKAVATLSKLATAYAIARSIKQKGIKPSGFFDRAIQVVQIQMTDRLGAGLKVDIINSLPKTI